MNNNTLKRNLNADFTNFNYNSRDTRKMFNKDEFI